MFRFPSALVLGVLALVGCEDDGIRYGGGRPPLTQGGTGTGTGTGNGQTTGNVTNTGSAILATCNRVLLDGTCKEYLGPDWEGGAAEADCNNGDFGQARCPGPSQVGRCTDGLGTLLEVWTYFYVGDYYDQGDAGSLQNACELNGGNWRDPI